MSTTINVSVTSPADWKYISEGGSSIVFSYAGPASPYFTGTALRLRKTSTASGQVDLPVLHDTPDEEEPDDPTIVFQRRVTQRLVPEEYLPRLVSANVTEPWLSELHEIHNEHRPQARRGKDGIAVKKAKAVLADDLVGGEGFVVEIKPKWGFLPSSVHLSPRSKLTKTTTCRFCMHAHLKSTDGKDVSLGYCPLDLFSGDKVRVMKAMHNLWDAWIGSSGQVNNLRVFVGGTMLKPTSLVRPQHFGDPTLSDLRDAFTAALLPALLQTPILQKLSNLQQTLDPLDIEGLTALWSEASETAIPPLGQGLAEPTLSDWDAFLDVYHTKHSTMDHDHPDVANLRYYCLAYLLSASFKDCSIMIRVKPGGETSVAVIDLDVKPIDRLHKWALLDAEIVQAYEGIAEPTKCVDRWAM
ncbi:inositol-pentakisphosphate 2-kinase [Irpex rosettiformis]|uniref:Inositol-pentakisphosphate 2-kinase n=1 Tax=Irpex rosettiformis TaxID=378272 RepID=A0ACB8UJW7_9APHY|nr:inositol-pentakisphosphate 2-kinase [Irpex rosettiformis]